MKDTEDMKPTQAQIEAALEESELSDMICRMAKNCRCVGDENGADTDKAFCFNVARAVRNHVLAALTAAAEVGEQWKPDIHGTKSEIWDTAVAHTIERCAQVADRLMVPGVADEIRALQRRDTAAAEVDRAQEFYEAWVKTRDALEKLSAEHKKLKAATIERCAQVQVDCIKAFNARADNAYVEGYWAGVTDKETAIRALKDKT